MISLEHVSKVYTDRSFALADVSAELPDGGFTAIIGRSGAGKSTLLRCLNGMLPVTSGSIRMDGTDMTALRGREKRAMQRRIGMIFQDFGLVGQSTAEQNVLNGCLGGMSAVRVLLGLFTKEQHARAAELLERVGLSEKAEQKADSLSGGEKQRTAIARVLMQGCDVILADEPVASLDPVYAKSVLELLKTLQTEQGKTIVMNSHNVAQAVRYSDRILGIRAGRLVFSGTPAELDDAALACIYGEEEPEG